MPKTLALALVAVALALATTSASAAAPKVTSIRLVSDGGFVARHSATAVDARNRAALTRTAALVPARLPRLPPLENGCMDCILNTLTIMRGGHRLELRWYNGAPISLRPLLAALAKNGRHSGNHN
jgi:hypothetical protein